jgi:flagellar M-ring protein FliF
MGGLSRLREQAGELWQGLTKSKKITLISAAVATVVFIILAAYWFGQPNYATLFSGLVQEDAGEIVAKLKEEGIPYQLKDGGKTILVPQEKVYETRLNLAASGMPKGGSVGFELFNQNQLGSTDFDRKLKYNWALQGELVRTIRQINEVADARVHIVQPQDSLFIQDEKPATASVFLKLKPLASLKEEQILAIANLVSGSVSGLALENVTILDQHGRLLSENIETESGPMGGKAVATQMELKRKYEKELERSIQSMLERVYGPGKAVARVNADMDFDWSESNSETYEPLEGTGGLVKTEDEREESFQGQGSFPGGPSGVASNVPGYAAEDQGSSNYEKRERSTTYELNKKQEKKVTSPGQVKRVAATVWVDGNLSPRQQTQIEEAVKATVGFKDERGDQVTIQTLPFDRSWAEDLGQPDKEPLSPYLLVLLLLIPIAIYLLYRILKGDSQPQGGVDLLVGPEAETELAAAEAPESEDTTRLDNLDRLERMARQQPKEVAKLIETWLHEEQGR